MNIEDYKLVFSKDYDKLSSCDICEISKHYDPFVCPEDNHHILICAGSDQLIGDGYYVKKLSSILKKL